MRDQFKKIPAPVQRVILLRLAGFLLGAVILVLALASGGNWALIVPGIAIMFYALTSAGLLFLRYLEGAVLQIEGICVGLEKSALRKRVQAIHLRTNQYDIKLISKHNQIRDLAVGDTLVIYLQDNTPVYDSDGQQIICDYITIKKARAPESKLAH